jgi:hypothetical protein
MFDFVRLSIAVTPAQYPNSRSLRSPLFSPRSNATYIEQIALDLR